MFKFKIQWKVIKYNSQFNLNRIHFIKQFDWAQSNKKIGEQTFQSIDNFSM